MIQCFPLKEIRQGYRNKTGYPLLPLIFNTVLEFLARLTQQEKVIRGIQIEKVEVKLFLIRSYI